MKYNRRLHILLSVFLVMLCLASTSPTNMFNIVEVAAADPPGVGSTPAYVTTPSTWTYYVDSSDTSMARSYYGLYTVTDFDNEIKLIGPPVIKYAPIYSFSYVKSASLTIQRIESYEPAFLIRSSSWYAHTIEMESTNAQSFSFEVTQGISTLDGNCKIAGGYSKTTSTTTTMGWSITAQYGETKIVYIRMIFLRVFGSVTYNLAYGGTETRTYDAAILVFADFNNYCIRLKSGAYTELPVGDNTYYDNPSDGDTLPDVFYSMGSKLYSYSDAQSTSTSLGIELEVGPKVFAFTGESKFTWSTSTTVSIKHTFVGNVPSYIAYYFIYQNNFFNVNIDAIPKPSGGGGGGGFLP